MDEEKKKKKGNFQHRRTHCTGSALIKLNYKQEFAQLLKKRSTLTEQPENNSITKILLTYRDPLRSSRSTNDSKEQKDSTPVSDDERRRLLPLSESYALMRRSDLPTRLTHLRTRKCELCISKTIVNRKRSEKIAIDAVITWPITLEILQLVSKLF
ncbi:unnamed protein product [Pleuronectes platessa]|uniref:Uncharacterized protein n=1 Tax=Pleuronectes platessa TaxID=8262 RepID=A0A9N7VP69_PLEPL|nr:unnamed protein product [Pleuronectes platessa]